MNWILFAETHLAEVSLQYRDEGTSSPSQLWFLLIPVLAIAIGCLIYRLHSRPAEAIDTPAGLLTEIAIAHGLRNRTIDLLHRIARAAELEQPATLLLNIEAFEATVNKATKRIRLDKRQQSDLGMIRRRLFAA